jgi:predicted restriction endonuclease
MIREFLLFLSHYGFCQLTKGKNNATDQFFIQQEYMNEIEEIIDVLDNTAPVLDIVIKIRTNDIITNTERQKILTQVLARPNQAQFRKQVLSRFDSTCILTGEKMNIVLEACHIVPVEHNGVDSFINGLCMRADIHTLFDAKHIRFHENGRVEYSDAIQESQSYSQLPQQIIIPPFISKEALAWRFDYY